jgi:dTMP kinase
MKNQKGKFIVLDGTDGSGKATQTEILAERLREAGHQVEVADFPQYGNKSAGLVEEYLNGKFGEADAVGPYRASIFYAADRYAASFKIKKWLDAGKIVISNRYVTANMAHQGGKIKDDAKRKKYFSWLYKLEYKLFKIPQPDLNIILHVPAEIAQKMVDQKESRAYIGGAKRDIHEADLNHLKNAEKVYLEIAKSFPGFTLVECVRAGQIMSREEISDLIWKKIKVMINDKLLMINEYAKKINNQNEQLPYYNVIRRSSGEDIGELRVKRLTATAKLPTRAHESDAGLDLYADDYYLLAPGDMAEIKTGIAMEIPAGYAGLAWDKSGLAKRGLKTLAGVVDSGYRGEIIVIVKNLGSEIFSIEQGQKIAQLLIQKVELLKIKEASLKASERGEKGFGSSGLF